MTIPSLEEGIEIKIANATDSGYLTYIDWNIFNNKADGNVFVQSDSPIQTSNVTNSTSRTYTLSIPQSNSTTNGYLSAIDWNRFNAATSSNVADGDYGDITITSNGSIWTIDSGVITDSKLSSNISVTKLRKWRCK